MEAIGFIGLGIMGNAMALNLVADGHSVVVWNRTPAKADDVVEVGAERAGSPADVARRCAVVMVCVSDTADVNDVVFGEEGVASALQPGGLVIDHSTISPAATKRFAATIDNIGGHWLDAPVSGGSEGAANGTLSIMVGGDIEQLTRAMPYM
ncbi:MAG: NAD(P)-binding domain-containing protein, partial [Actinomycetota bacterium]